MNGNEEVLRPRPISGGIWTLFSWLRRADRFSSSSSSSSSGSDRTVASFDFLAPTEYGFTNPPIVLPNNLPTDTYKKRLYDRNIRRQQDRDITIHRKYGLVKFEAFETFTLPNTRYIKSDNSRIEECQKHRRATSECYSRRTAYVPGKRRAPLPPVPVVSATLPRYKRKRPAPKPPNVTIESIKENRPPNGTQMNNATGSDRFEVTHCTDNLVADLQRSNKIKEREKLSKDKSFLKQIFENRKRNSAIDTSHVKLLPSISELDRQALEIIETNKAHEAFKRNNNDLSGRSDNPWICTKCLRKYPASELICLYCKTPDSSIGHKWNNRFSMHAETDLMVQTRRNRADEKEKLKEMLKEMKNSLPKRTKQDKQHVEIVADKLFSESCTLRIGSTAGNTKEQASTSGVSNNCANVSVQISKILNDCKTKENFLNSEQRIVSSIRSGAVKDIKKDSAKTNEVSHERVTVIDSKDNKSPEIKLKPAESVINDNNPKKVTELSTSTTTNQNSCNASSSKISLTDHKLQQAGAHASKNILHSKSILPKSDPVINEPAHSDFGPKLSPKSPNVQNKDLLKNTSKSKNLETPLKISALLNPVDTEKWNTSVQRSETAVASKFKNEEVQTVHVNKVNIRRTSPKRIIKPNNPEHHITPQTVEEIKPSTSQLIKNNALLSSPGITPSPIRVQKECIQKSGAEEINTTNNTNLVAPSSSTNTSLDILNHHSYRRNLVNQLEQSILKGDEKTAASAAAELAKLRLSCSVLSFSSQILATTPVPAEDKGFSSAHNNTSTGSKVKAIIEESLSQASASGSKKQEKLKVQDGVINSKNIPVIDQDHINDKPSTSFVTKPLTSLDANRFVSIEVWVEDKEAARGPVQLHVRRNAVMADLMRQAEISLGIAIDLQRWIVGKNLCSDDKLPLLELAGADFTAPFYLCLVQSGSKENTPANDGKIIKETKKSTENISEKSGDVYKELIELEKEAVVPNSDPFECEVCMEQCANGEGVVLRECIHIFCKNCLSDAVRHCEEPVVSCPAVGCSGSLQEREIRALLSSEEYERWLARSLAAAECGTRNTFHCRTTDCTGWAFCEQGVRKFPCPVCKHTNCIPCQALHENETCEKYQEKLKKAVSGIENDQIDEGTRTFLNTLIRRGEALECPECNAVITKKWGCDWVKCSACKTEICWVTKGRRWGPAGKGDTSAGCRCGVDGKRCHPTCGYCH